LRAVTNTMDLKRGSLKGGEWRSRLVPVAWQTECCLARRAEAKTDPHRSARVAFSTRKAMFIAIAG
jgi:hypothetical protein